MLVTGGAGFIGSAVVRHLLRDSEASVVNVDKLTYAASLAALPNEHPRHRLEIVDICDEHHIGRIFGQYQPSAVIHLAAESHVDRSIDGPAEFVRTNLVGTYTMLQETLRYWRQLPGDRARDFRFIHISTDEVFGSLGAEGLFSETSPYAPNSPYSATKAGSDHLVRAWRETYGLPTVITNCSNNFGPYQFPEKLIPTMILCGLEGRPMPIYGDGLNVRDWLYVEDHAEAMIQVLVHGVVGQSYNIGARNERTNRDLVEMICAMLDRHVPKASLSHRALIEFVVDRPGHDRRYAIDPSRIEAELGWRPRASFEAQLDETIRWYLDNRTWWDAIRKRGFEPKRLGVGEAPDLAPTSSAGVALQSAGGR